VRLPRLIVPGLAVVLFLVSVSAQGCTGEASNSTTTASAAVQYAAAPPPPPESTTTMLHACTGTVKTFNPPSALAGVLVTAKKDATVVAETTTGAEGTYALYVPAGTYTLTGRGRSTRWRSALRT
jgi:hypothetical protein